MQDLQARASLAQISDKLRAEVPAGKATVHESPCDSSHRDVDGLPTPG
jgi:hypothetical protein